jgi:hypothetical protein
MSTQTQTSPTPVHLAHSPPARLVGLATTSKQLLSARDEDLIAEITAHKLSGVEVSFPDKSVWAIGDTLSEVELLQEHSPSTGRQAFVARLKSDPSGYFSDFPEAVMQINFQ